MSDGFLLKLHTHALWFGCAWPCMRFAMRRSMHARRSVLLAACDTSSDGPLSSMSSAGSDSECEWGYQSSCLNMSHVPPLALHLAKQLISPAVQPSLGQRAEDARIVAVANVDSFGDLVPPRCGWLTASICFVCRLYVSCSYMMHVLTGNAQHMSQQCACDHVRKRSPIHSDIGAA